MMTFAVSDKVCRACGHQHAVGMGGICIGCPCPGDDTGPIYAGVVAANRKAQEETVVTLGLGKKDKS